MKQGTQIKFNEHSEYYVRCPTCGLAVKAEWHAELAEVGRRMHGHVAIAHK